MPVTTKKTVGEKLKEIADDQGESSYAIADGTSLSRSTVQSIFDGQSEDPGFSKVAEIADYLGEDLNEIK